MKSNRMIQLAVLWARNAQPQNGQFATIETTRKLGRVNFRKDFWDCSYGQGKKKWPIAGRRIPEPIAGHFSAPVLFSWRSVELAILQCRVEVTPTQSRANTKQPI